MFREKAGTGDRRSAASSAARVMDLLAAIRLFFGEIRQSALGKADGALRRMEYLFAVYLWVSIGLFLMVLGLFFLAIDFGHIPRGFVFSIGGLLVFLAAVIFLQTSKIRKTKG
jgi:hypothetical protein